MQFSSMIYTKARVTIDGVGDVRALSGSITSRINELPEMRILLSAKASDERADNIGPETIEDLYKLLNGVAIGTQVTWKADILYRPEGEDSETQTIEDVTLCTGLFAGWSQLYIRGYARAVLWLNHPLAGLRLASGMTDERHGRGWQDYALPMVSVDKDDVTIYTPGEYTATNAEEDLWKNVIKKELILQCRQHVFSDVNNEACAAYLENEDNDLSEVPLSLSVGDAKAAISYVRGMIGAGLEEGRTSLWENLQRLAREFHFSVLCRPVGFSVAPILPLLGGDAPEQILPVKSFMSRNEYNYNRPDPADSVAVLQQSGDYPGFFDGVTRDYYEAADIISPPFGTHVYKAPAWITGTFSAASFTKTTLGLGDDGLFVAGMHVTSEEDEWSGVTYNDSRSAGADRAFTAELQTRVSETRYSERTAVLKGSVTFDISPGCTVRLEPPLVTLASNTLTDPDDSEIFYVGFVQSVVLNLSEDEDSRCIWLGLTHLRTNTEQSALETGRHPMYDKRWVRAPFVPVEGLTTDSEAD